jgi:hypothetical protein
MKKPSNIEEAVELKKPANIEESVEYGDAIDDPKWEETDLRDWCSKMGFYPTPAMPRDKLLQMLNTAEPTLMFRLRLHDPTNDLLTFLRQGYVKIADAIPRENVQKLFEMTTARHEELNGALLRYNGGELTGQRKTRKFQEVVIWNPNNLQHRDVDMPDLHKFRSAKVEAFLAEMAGLWPPELAGSGVGSREGPFKVAHSGLLMSRPGSVDQQLHRDIAICRDDDIQNHWTPPSHLNVFVPLVPLTRENGATEIFPRTQLPWVHVTEATPEYFTADAGEAIVMDQRCYHRGKANLSTKDRPVAYFIYQRARDRGLNADGTPVDENYQRTGWPSVFDEAPSDESSSDEAPSDEASSDEAEPPPAPPAEQTPSRKRKDETQTAEKRSGPKAQVCNGFDKANDREDNRTSSKQRRRLLEESDDD